MKNKCDFLKWIWIFMVACAGVALVLADSIQNVQTLDGSQRQRIANLGYVTSSITNGIGGQPVTNTVTTTFTNAISITGPSLSLSGNFGVGSSPSLTRGIDWLESGTGPGSSWRMTARDSGHDVDFEMFQGAVNCGIIGTETTGGKYIPNGFSSGNDFCITFGNTGNAISFGQFSTKGVMRMTANGLGILTNTPAQALHVNGNVQVENNLLMKILSGSSTNGLFFGGTAYSITAPNMWVDASTNLHINARSGKILYLNNESGTTLQIDNTGGTGYVSVDGAGNVTVSGGSLAVTGGATFSAASGSTLSGGATVTGGTTTDTLTVNGLATVTNSLNLSGGNYQFKGVNGFTGVVTNGSGTVSLVTGIPSATNFYYFAAGIVTNVITRGTP